MKLRQLFFIEGRLLGETPRGLTRIHETYQAPLSDLYFCQHCGDVYARLPVLLEDGAIRPWQSYRCTCRKCFSKSHSQFEVPGSVWRSWDQEFLAALPVPVLQWELERHIQHLERF